MSLHQCGKTLLRRHVYFAILIVLFIGGSAPVDSEACTSTTNRVSHSSPGTISIQAATTQENCSGRTVRVEAWIDGRIFECSWDPTSTGNCFDVSTDANAVVSAFDDGCGTWTGRSAHSYSQGGQTTNLGNGQLALNGGPCEEEENCEQGWIWYEGVCVAGSPIIISTGRITRYKLTSMEEGVVFDINGDGVPEQVAWTDPDASVAFLALDRNGDGQITSGLELFGNHTLPGSPNGFNALQKMAMQSNGGIERGSVSSDDPLFARLLLWTDRNHNGISEPRELSAAADVVSEIGLGYDVTKRVDRHGNIFKYKGWVHIRTGLGRNGAKHASDSKERARPIFDVYFAMAR